MTVWVSEELILGKTSRVGELEGIAAALLGITNEGYTPADDRLLLARGKVEDIVTEECILVCLPITLLDSFTVTDDCT